MHLTILIVIELWNNELVMLETTPISNITSLAT